MLVMTEKYSGKDVPIYCKDATFLVCKYAPSIVEYYIVHLACTTFLMTSSGLPPGTGTKSRDKAV